MKEFKRALGLVSLLTLILVTLGTSASFAASEVGPQDDDICGDENAVADNVESRKSGQSIGSSKQTVLKKEARGQVSGDGRGDTTSEPGKR